MAGRERRTPTRGSGAPACAFWLTLATLALLAASACARSSAAALGWIRRGTVYIAVDDRAELRLTIEPAHGPADYAYLYGPDGRAIARKELAPEFRGHLTVPLPAAGVYTFVPSPSHRFRLEVKNARLVLEPEREFPTLFQTSDGTPLTFEVPAGTDSFAVSATNQFDWSGSAAEIRLYAPDGALAHTFTFEDLDEEKILAKLGTPPEVIAHYRAQGDTTDVPEFRLLVSRWRADRPAPGRWRVVANVRGARPDDLGFWLDGIPNLVGPEATPLFVPQLPATRATVRIDPATRLGPLGDIGAVWGWTVYRDEALAAYREMGLTGSVHFFPQVDMEPVNDDDDPEHTDMTKFVFAPFVDRLALYRDGTLPLTELMILSRIAPWAQKSLPEIAEYVEACVRYHEVEAGLSPDKLYWQFLNEPNHDVDAGTYVEAFRAVGARLRERLEAHGTPVCLGGPGTGNAWSERDALPSSWIEDLLAKDDRDLDFVVWNQYRLGRIDDTWRFRTHVEKVDSLITALDSDGQHEEIVIGATNLAGGVVLQTERQDGYYSAVWWPSVLCQTLGTGRCRLVCYFFLIDQGARRKGLLRADWSRKPVALATTFTRRYLRAEVIGSSTDHGGLDVIATRDPATNEVCVVLVNKMPRDVEVDLVWPGSAGRPASAELFDTRTGERRSVAWGDRFALPAYTLAGAAGG